MTEWKIQDGRSTGDRKGNERSKDQRVQGEGGLKASASSGPELEEEEKEESGH